VVTLLIKGILGLGILFVDRLKYSLYQPITVAVKARTMTDTPKTVSDSNGGSLTRNGRARTLYYGNGRCVTKIVVLQDIQKVFFDQEER